MPAKKKSEPKADEPTADTRARPATPPGPSGAGGTLTDTGGRPVADEGGRIVNRDDPHPSVMPAATKDEKST